MGSLLPGPRPLNLAVDYDADNGPCHSRGLNGILLFIYFVTVHTLYTMCMFTQCHHPYERLHHNHLLTSQNVSLLKVLPIGGSVTT